MRVRFEWLTVMLALACGGRLGADGNPTNGAESGGTGAGGSTLDPSTGASGGTSPGDSPIGGNAATGGSFPEGGTSTGGEATGGSATSSASCEELRAEFLAIYEKMYAIASLCDKDSDCTYVSFGHDCGSICPAPMNKLMPAVIGEPLYEFAAENCGSCWENYDSACSKPPEEMICLEGKCVFTVPYPEQGQLAY